MLGLSAEQAAAGTSYVDSWQSWPATRGKTHLEKSDVELPGYAGGGGDLVVPGGVVQRLPVSAVVHMLLQHHAQPKYKATLHLHSNAYIRLK